MEATITQSSALYLAQHRNGQGRRAVLRHLRIAARQRPTNSGLFRAVFDRPLRGSVNGR